MLRERGLSYAIETLRSWYIRLTRIQRNDCRSLPTVTCLTPTRPSRIRPVEIFRGRLSGRQAGPERDTAAHTCWYLHRNTRDPACFLGTSGLMTPIVTLTEDLGSPGPLASGQQHLIPLGGEEPEGCGQRKLVMAGSK